MKARAAVAPAACAALLVAGCGGGGGTTASFTGPDPASVTPADAPIFAEALVRPEGDQKDAVDSALSKLLATDDPGSLITDQLDQRARGAVQGLHLRGRRRTMARTEGGRLLQQPRRSG